MSNQRSPSKRAFGLSLDKELVDYIDAVAKKEDRNRTYIITRCVKDFFAKRCRPLKAKIKK